MMWAGYGSEAAVSSAPGLVVSGKAREGHQRITARVPSTPGYVDAYGCRLPFRLVHVCHRLLSGWFAGFVS